MRATGHEIDIGEPRHPLSVCGTCLRTHISMALTQGKICVRCPFDGCGRALQTRELKDHVSQGVYQGLLEALRAAEEEHDVTEITAALAGFSRELRHCPRCRVLIEKNEGCSSMRCCAPRDQYCPSSSPHTAEKTTFVHETPSPSCSFWGAVREEVIY